MCRSGWRTSSRRKKRRHATATNGRGFARRRVRAFATVALLSAVGARPLRDSHDRAAAVRRRRRLVRESVESSEPQQPARQLPCWVDKTKHVTLMDEKLWDYPFIHVTGGNIHFNGAEVVRL